MRISSNGILKVLPSSKPTSIVRERWCTVIAVGWRGVELAFMRGTESRRSVAKQGVPEGDGGKHVAADRQSRKRTVTISEGPASKRLPEAWKERHEPYRQTVIHPARRLHRVGTRTRSRAGSRGHRRTRSGGGGAGVQTGHPKGRSGAI